MIMVILLILPNSKLVMPEMINSKLKSRREIINRDPRYLIEVIDETHIIYNQYIYDI